jgi:hypothetical protein
VTHLEQPHRPARQAETPHEPLTEQPRPPDCAAPGPRSVEQVLAEAIAVMTEAARLTWTRIDRDGRTVTVKGDWAEFVSLALAGAAANVGGIDDALAGRPGSWEADHVRSLVTSTVGEDEQQLLGHRTEPVIVDVFVDEIMAELGMWKAYDDAQQELTGRYTDCTSATPVEASKMPMPTVEQEQRLDELAELEERLENQRLRDWSEYGQELKTQIEAAAGRRPLLRVPVVVHIDVETFRADAGRYGALQDQLLREAIGNTPLPGATEPLRTSPERPFPSPLSRLTASAPARAAGTSRPQCDEPDFGDCM